MRPDQTPNEVCARVMTALSPIIEESRPDLLLVQGDTTTALAGALTGFHHGVPVGHVEAGLRSGNPTSPFPEEMNRRLISRIATLHFAATLHNQETLIAESVPPESVVVTGNPVVDALHHILKSPRPTGDVDSLIASTRGTRRIVLTTHRRESLGQLMRANLKVLQSFVASRPDVSLIFPVHPNPSVVAAAERVLAGTERIHLIDPLDYQSFIHLLSSAWLVVSDSGGIQEEAPSLGKPVLILRENTERPEAVESGVARLVGGDPNRLAEMLDAIDRDPSWIDAVREIENPFGRGDSASKIYAAVSRLLNIRETGSDAGLKNEITVSR
jgi:UDP-N-acetylglucosamine 2-epimerase (non-hydrolysing)